MASTTLTLRLAPNDHELLVALAKVRNQTVSDLTRHLLLDGIDRLLDPTEIDKSIERERVRLQETAAQLRARAKESAVANTPDLATADSTAGDDATERIHEGRTRSPDSATSQV